MIELSRSEYQSFRDSFLNAYEDFTNRKVFLENLKSNPQDPVINEILSHVREVLTAQQRSDKKIKLTSEGEIMSFGSIKKVLLTTDHYFENNPTVNFQPNLHHKIATYTFLSTQIESSNPFTSALQGSYFIDSDFRLKIQTDSKGFKPIDFYVFNQNTRIQWKGIAEELDGDRDITIRLKGAVYRAFNFKNCKICAVILGKIGAGKSTILRRLAWDLVENGNFTILWIYSLKSFLNEVHEIKKVEKKFLLIIDNWNDYKNALETKTAFLSQLADFDNARVIIGDIEYDTKVYADHVYSKGYFTIDNDDIYEVLDKVFDKVPEWQELYYRIGTFDKYFFRSPILLILLLICKISVINKFSTIDEDDFTYQFQRVVKAILNRLYSKYKGLALVLYYWAHINMKYGLYISHVSFFELARRLQGEKRRNVRPGVETMLNEQILYFFTLKQLVVPGHEQVFFLNFYHECLTDVITQVVDGRWFYDDRVELRVLKYLVAIGDDPVASDLFIQIANKNRFLKNNFTDYGEKFLGPLNKTSFLNLVCFHAALSYLNANLRTSSDDDLELSIIYVIDGFYQQGFKTADIDAFFYNLIERGYSAPIVLEIYNDRVNDDYISRLVDYGRKKGKKYTTLVDFYKLNSDDVSDLEKKGLKEKFLGIYLTEHLKRE